MTFLHRLALYLCAPLLVLGAPASLALPSTSPSTLGPLESMTTVAELDSLEPGPVSSILPARGAVLSLATFNDTLGGQNVVRSRAGSDFVLDESTDSPIADPRWTKVAAGLGLIAFLIGRRAGVL